MSGIWGVSRSSRGLFSGCIWRPRTTIRFLVPRWRFPDPLRFGSAAPTRITRTSENSSGKLPSVSSVSWETSWNWKRTWGTAWRKGRAVGQTPVLPPEEADPLSERAEHIEQGVKELLAQIGRTLQQVARDPLSGFDAFTDLNTLRSNLSYLRREMIPRARRTLEKRAPGLEATSPEGEDQGSLLQKFQQAQKEITAELERMALLADDIGKRSGIRDLANIGERLAQAQNQLLDAFDQALREGSLQAREALSEALKKVEELLQELARGFQNLSCPAP